MDWQALMAPRNARMKASEIRELLKVLDQPDIISFAGGIPDPALFPRKRIAQAYAQILADGSDDTGLQYSASEGYAPLREWIVDHMETLGVTCDIDNILITSGSQQALDYLGKLFLDTNNSALVSWPTYLGALGAFNAYQPKYVRLDILPNHDNTGPAKFAYVCADFANPTGETLTNHDRMALLERADQEKFAVIEDGAYQALRYDGDPVAPILALEIAKKGSIENCSTIYIGSFSKTLAPGLRIGWTCAAKPVIRQMVLLKQASDLHSPSINQMVVADVANDGFDAHVATLRMVYRERRDVMLTTLNKHMPSGVTWNKPEGGMFIWLTLPDHMDGAVLLEHALNDARVAFVPGAAFHADGSGKNTMRLNFSMADAEKINKGIAALSKVIEGYV